MLDGSICTPEEQALSRSSHGASIVCLTRSDSIGLFLVVESGFISLIAVVGVFVLIFYNATRNKILIRHPTDIYMLSLFSFDFIMSLAMSMNIKWVHDGKVFEGSFCTAQGILQQAGNTGSALATLAIAIHTFVVLLWGSRRHRYFVAYTIVGLTWLIIWLFIIITVTVYTSGSNFYYRPVGYWCWIGDHYKTEQFIGQYVWLWVTMIVSFLTYTPLFFWARGIITVSPSRWWKFQVHKEPLPVVDPNGMKRRSIAMIAYPIGFTVLTLPLSVVRLKSGFSARLPSATFAVESIYSLSGVLNVTLILLTRSPLLLPRGASKDRRGSEVAPSNSVLEVKHGFPEISRPDAVTMGIGIRNKPVSLGLLAEEGDVEWYLPSSEQGSTQSV